MRNRITEEFYLKGKQREGSILEIRIPGWPTDAIPKLFHKLKRQKFASMRSHYETTIYEFDATYTGICLDRCHGGSMESIQN